MDPQIPNHLYWMIGVLVAANIGSIGCVLYMSFKIVWWAARMDHRTEDHKTRLDDHEEQIRQLREVYRHS